jgi:hypothetical protein
MTITVLAADGSPFDQNSIETSQRFIRELVRLVFSGNYVTGGDTLDLTNGGGTPAAPTVVPAAQSRGLIELDLRPVSKLVTSFTAIDGQYIPIIAGGVLPIPFTSLATAIKIKAMLDIGSEYAAGAYGADILGDIVIAELIWAR